MSDNARRIHEWETVEAERSRRDARRSTASGTDRFPKNVERYMNPQADTCYAWEYAYGLIGDVRNRVVLDLGCGAGENTYVLALRGARVIGIDISPELIALASRSLRARNLDDRVTLVVGSGHALPVIDHSVDALLGMAILHHLDLALVSREVHRVLRPGGTATFVEPVRDSLLLRWLRSLIPYRSADVSSFERPLTTREIDRFARGFSSVSTRHFSLPHIWFGQALGLPEPVLSYFHRLDRRALAWLPFLRNYSSVQVFQLIK